MRFLLAIQCFFRVLLSAAFAQQVRPLIQGDGEGEAAEPSPSPSPATPPAPSRSEAISLLAALQREARFVDIVNESLDGYSDAQIGAAARDVLKDCGKVVNRLFALRPVVEAPEGDLLEVPEDYDTGRFRLTGNLSHTLPVEGTVQHCGWEATQCDVPSWTGPGNAARVIAPAEVQIP